MCAFNARYSNVDSEPRGFCARAEHFFDICAHGPGLVHNVSKDTDPDGSSLKGKTWKSNRNTFLYSSGFVKTNAPMNERKDYDG